MDFILNNRIFLLNLIIIPIVLIVLQYKIFLNSKKHSYQIKIFSQYIATRQATNDLIEVIIYNIKLSNILINKSKEIIKSIQHNKDETLFKLDKISKIFNDFVVDIESSNKSSIDRSYSKDLIYRGRAKSPIKSLIFWIPTLISLILLYINFISLIEFFIHPLLFLLIVFIEILLLYLINKSFNKSRLLNQNTEFQILSFIDLFKIRRLYIEDTNKSLIKHIDELNNFSNYCKTVPQAKGYLTALNILKRNSNGLTEIFEITNINIDVPLISLSDYLNKNVKNKYLPAAAKYNIKFINNIKPGLSLCISPKNIDRLIDPIVENSLKYSGGGESIILNGMPKSGKNIIEIIDNGSSISNENMQNIFEVKSQKAILSSADRIGLSLRIIKLILSTIGGEIKIYSSNKSGLKVRLIIPRTKKHESIKIIPKISKSISPI